MAVRQGYIFQFGKRTMGQVIRSSECRNSPKNAAVEDIVVTMFTKPQDFKECLADDVTLHLADGTEIEGSDATVLYISRHVQRSFDILNVDHAITHGRVGAANGIVSINGRQTGFGVFVEFVNTKADRLKRIKLYGL